MGSNIIVNVVFNRKIAAKVPHLHCTCIKNYSVPTYTTTPSWSLWRQCNDFAMLYVMICVSGPKQSNRHIVEDILELSFCMWVSRRRSSNILRGFAKRFCKLWVFELWIFVGKIAKNILVLSVSLSKCKTCTVKPVCNDHLCNKIYYLWFIQ